MLGVEGWLAVVVSNSVQVDEGLGGGVLFFPRVDVVEDVMTRKLKPLNILSRGISFHDPIPSRLFLIHMKQKL